MTKRFNEIGFRPVRVELHVPGFDLNQATKSFKASRAARQKKRADQPTPPSRPQPLQPEQQESPDNGEVVVSGNPETKGVNAELFSLEP